MLPVFLKVFDEKLLFAQGVTEGSQSIPLYTVFSGQTALYFCLIEGDERRETWYRIAHSSGRKEDEPFAEIVVNCKDGHITVTDTGSILQQINDIEAEFMRTSSDYDILGIDRACKDPEVFERACETQKLIFSEHKNIQVICDNAEHRLTSRYMPPPPPKPSVNIDIETPGTVSFIARSITTMATAGMVLIITICLLYVIYLYITTGRPVIEIVRL